MNGAPISPTATPFFVTHDRVALAYALAMGVSSIYFFNKTSDKKDYIAVFDGRAQSKEKKEENERKRNEYCEGLYADITDIKGLWEWYSGPLLDARTTALNTQLEKVIGNPGRNDGLTAQLSGFLGRAREEERHRTELEKLLKDIFRAAMIHTSIEQLIPGDLKDPSTLVESDPCLAYETAKTLTKLKAQHGGDNFIPATVLDGRQIEKSKTYKTLAEWQIAASSVRYKNSGTESRYTIINRNAPPQNPEEVRDAFSFLAYIANSRSSALKNGIAEACHVLQQQIFASDPVDQAAKTEMYLNDMVGGPSVKARERIEVGLRDILTQTYLYLKCEPEDNPFIFGNVGRAEPGTVIDFIKQATKIRLFVPRQGDPYDSGGVLQRFYTGIKLLYSRFRSFIDHPPESDTTYGDTQGGGGKQTGGWGEGTQLTLTEDLDTRQTTDPGLHALIEAEVYSLLDDLALTRTQLEDVGVFGQGDPENLQPAGAGAGTGLGQSVTNASDVPQRLDLSASASTASMASSGASSPMSLDTASAGSAAFGQSASNASTASNEAMDEGRPSQGGGGRGDYLTSKGWTQQREGVWRDPATFLDYIEDIATGFQRARDGQTGGAVSKETLKPKLAIWNVMGPLLALTADQIQTDTHDMKDATNSQLEYYTQGIDLLTAIQAKDPSVELALATYDLLCCSRFMEPPAFQIALGITDPYEAETLRLFFSGLETYSLKKAPIFAGDYIQGFGSLGIQVKPVTKPKTYKEIQDQANAIIQTVLTKFPPEFEPKVSPPEETTPLSSRTNTPPSSGDITAPPSPISSASSSAVSSPARQKGGKRRPLFTTP
jgi:hypothetical protein